MTSNKFKPFVMRKLLLLLLAGSFAVACNNNKDKTGSDTRTTDDDTAETSSPPTTTTVPPAPPPGEEILGSFVGPFGDNRITFLISRTTADSIEGRTIVGGNDRTFKGTYTLNDGVYNAVAKEPGDHKDDGVFTFSLSKSNLNQVTGSWKPNDTKRPAKEFTLEKKKFEYKTDVGTFPEASQRLLKAEDVENHMKEDLEFMRNEIFARHGFSFNKKDLRLRFEMEDWYVPNTVDIKGFLTEIEKKNIALIKRYEKYAEEYGDEYGR